MPDFIVTKDGFAEFVEVKFRSGQPNSRGCKNLADLWPESQILFVCKTEPHFRIANISDFVETGNLTPLEKYEKMVVREDIVEKYAKQVIDPYGFSVRFQNQDTKVKSVRFSKSEGAPYL